MHGIVVVVELQQLEQQQLGLQRWYSDHPDPVHEGEQHSHRVAVHGVVIELEQQLSSGDGFLGARR